MEVEERGTGIDSPQPDVDLPLQHLSVKIPECNDPDIPECVRGTVNECILDLTFELAFQASNECVRGGRLVVSSNDVKRAIDKITNVTTAPRWLKLDRRNRVRAEQRSLARFRWRGRRGASLQAQPEEVQGVATPSVNSNANGGAVAVSTSMRRERKAPACATCMMI
jgi:hypothetical protein